MSEQRCRICGSADFTNVDGSMICQLCGTKLSFTPPETRTFGTDENVQFYSEPTVNSGFINKAKTVPCDVYLDGKLILQNVPYNIPV